MAGMSCVPVKLLLFQQRRHPEGVKNRNLRHRGTVREGFEQKEISSSLNHMHIVKTLALEGVI